jgi:hypothetical protein
MRPYQEGQSLYNLIQTAIPDFVETDYPLFMEFMQVYLHFLEQRRTFTSTTIEPIYGVVPDGTISVTDVLGGPLYESRKLLDYLDVESTLDEFKSHFLNSFGKSFPQYSYVPLDVLVRSLRQFYQAKGTTDSIRWFFRTLFNEHADVYFPRADILKASDGTWIAPITLKVSSPIDNHPNTDVPKFYVGQRVETVTGSAQVESVVTYIVGQAFNQNIVVNELNLKFDTILGTFAPGQRLYNDDSVIDVPTTIVLVITGVTINSGGSNYAAGDVISFSEGPAGGFGFGAFGLVAAISNTAIDGVRILSGGDGYTTGLPVTFISTSGHGANAVVSEVVYGDCLLEDGSGYISLEQQSPNDSNLLQLEDVNVLFLELRIEPFVNALSNVIIQDGDYGTESGESQLMGVGFDSAIELSLSAVDVKPFMTPWVFTDPSETTATLANAACDLTLVTNTFFSNGATVFSLTTAQDLVSNDSTSNVSANVIVAQVAQGGHLSTLYLKDFRGLNKFTTNMLLKQSGNGVLQVGTLSCDGTANVFGTNTTFSGILTGNSHIRFQNGTQAVVRQVVNNTFLITESALGLVINANSYSIIPIGMVTAITPEEQRFYGKIKSIRLLNAGANYVTPPAVSADSVSGRAQQLFYLHPGADQLVATPDDSIVASADQIHVFNPATLAVQQDSGQIQKVSIINSGVEYQDANAVIVTAAHGTPRVGADAQFTPIIGAITKNPGLFTTSRGFLSSSKYLQDATFYNDYTYVIRVGESFDRYKDILLKLIHPAGFQPLGRVVLTLDTPMITPATATLEVRRPGLLPLDQVIAPYINVEVQDIPFLGSNI